MPEPSLWHLTLTTGHGRRSPRAEVTDDVLALVRPLVAAGGGTIHGLVVDVGPGVADGWAWFTLGWSETPDVFCVVCWSERGHAEAWREAMEHFRLAPIPTRTAGFTEPPVPWLTAEILVGAVARTPDQLAMLGDAERCVAWAIIESATTTC